MKKIFTLLLMGICILGCGNRSYQAFTSSGETIVVSKSILPPKIPDQFLVNESLAHLQMPSFLMTIKSTALYGVGNIVVINNYGNKIILTPQGPTPEFGEKFLQSRSVAGQVVGVKIKENDGYFVTFIPVDHKKFRWKNSLHAVVYQELESREVRIAYLNNRALAKLGKGIGYSKILKILSDSAEEIKRKNKK